MKLTLMIALMVLTRLSFGQNDFVEHLSASSKFTKHHDDYPNKRVIQNRMDAISVAMLVILDKTVKIVPPYSLLSLSSKTRTASTLFSATLKRG